MIFLFLLHCFKQFFPRWLTVVTISRRLVSAAHMSAVSHHSVPLSLARPRPSVLRETLHGTEAAAAGAWRRPGLEWEWLRDRSGRAADTEENVRGISRCDNAGSWDGPRGSKPKSSTRKMGYPLAVSWALGYLLFVCFPRMYLSRQFHVKFSTFDKKKHFLRMSLLQKQ